MAQTTTKKSNGEASRTVSFFRLVTEDEAGKQRRTPKKDWQSLLANLKTMSLAERTSEGPTRRLIGEVLSVDGEYALKLMEPRDENSWLEVLKIEKAKQAGDEGSDDGGTAAVDISDIGTLVETTILTFVLGENIFGMIQGSRSSPSHTAVAEWLTSIQFNGKPLLPDPKKFLVAEPVLSRAQKRKLKQSDGVSEASVRISTSKAEALERAGSKFLPGMLRSLRQEYEDDLIVTVTMRVPRGKAHDDARTKLKAETQKLRKTVGSAEAVTATLVSYDAEERARSEEVNFVAQRITSKTQVPLLGEDGNPIKNESAVRAILRAADGSATELLAE